MPAPAFYDYVRGLTDEVPEGYTLAGMRAYRHLVYLATIDEAYARGVLHVERGRPRPGRR